MSIHLETHISPSEFFLIHDEHFSLRNSIFENSLLSKVNVTSSIVLSRFNNELLNEKCLILF